MKMTVECILCHGPAKPFFEAPPKKYYQCGQCSAIFLDPVCYVSKEDERLRYQEHNNDVEDPGYQKFVAPIVSAVQETFGPECKGLDFGAGTGPVAAKLLRDLGYTIELYDPFFWNDPSVLEKKYDFIICCEVMEHFHFPAKEFRLLRSLLDPRGVLFCMTDVYSEKIDFKTWYYRNDKTHVFFYHQDTLTWIRFQFGFSAMESDGRLVRFTA
jgi:SAM-dependent methyltransferase